MAEEAADGGQPRLTFDAMKTDTTEAAPGVVGPASPLPSTIPRKRREPEDGEPMDEDGGGIEGGGGGGGDGGDGEGGNGNGDGGGISCICGFDHDDGFSIACDSCSTWSHAACFGVVDGMVPDEWRCHNCSPRAVDRDGASQLQRAFLKRRRDRRRHPSPARHRRASMLDNSKRKRRTSLAASATATVPAIATTIATTAEDEAVNVDDLYVSIDQDDVPDDDVRARIRAQACAWRGVSALDNVVVLDAPPVPAQTDVRPVPHPLASPSSVRPPSYAVRAREPIPRTRFISQFTSTVVPSAAYLGDPLNAYARHGMPRPFVHLLGPPLDLALDARVNGNHARFIRSGCRPNAVLRPVICPRSKRAKRDDADTAISFGVFALRDLKANEEIVLGWEWDDGSAIHHLPALLRTPELYPPDQTHHLRAQMGVMLHAFGDTFATCACGANAHGCALELMSAFVGGRLPAHARPPDLGPLVGKKRGFRTRETDGMGGAERVYETPDGFSRMSPGTVNPKPPSRKRSGKDKARKEDTQPLPRPRSVSPEATECHLPPKMRKMARRSVSASQPMDVDDEPPDLMPPPRIPAFLDPTTITSRPTPRTPSPTSSTSASLPPSATFPPSATPRPRVRPQTQRIPIPKPFAKEPSYSPSTPFANLSLVSPVSWERDSSTREHKLPSPPSPTRDRLLSIPADGPQARLPAPSLQPSLSRRPSYAEPIARNASGQSAQSHSDADSMDVDDDCVSPAGMLSSPPPASLSPSPHDESPPPSAASPPAHVLAGEIMPAEPAPAPEMLLPTSSPPLIATDVEGVQRSPTPLVRVDLSPIAVRTALSPPSTHHELSPASACSERQGTSSHLPPPLLALANSSPDVPLSDLPLTPDAKGMDLPTDLPSESGAPAGASSYAPLAPAVPPPPTPKVKMSLKDFTMRKKKQKEEQAKEEQTRVDTRTSAQTEPIEEGARSAAPAANETSVSSLESVETVSHWTSAPPAPTSRPPPEVLRPPTPTPPPPPPGDPPPLFSPSSSRPAPSIGSPTATFRFSFKSSFVTEARPPIATPPPVPDALPDPVGALARAINNRDSSLHLSSTLIASTSVTRASSPPFSRLPRRSPPPSDHAYREPPSLTKDLFDSVRDSSPQRKERYALQAVQTNQGSSRSGKDLPPHMSVLRRGDTEEGEVLLDPSGSPRSVPDLTDVGLMPSRAPPTQPRAFGSYKAQPPSGPRALRVGIGVGASSARPGQDRARDRGWEGVPRGPGSWGK